MKKYISFLLILCLTLPLFGCVSAPERGENGLSAYEIAQKNGFIGTEEEWLLSLVGEKGADGADGKNGADGADGKNGADGKDGKDGADGKDGKDGADGVTEQNTVIVGGEGDPLGILRYAAAVALRSAVSIVCPNSAGAGVIYRLDKETGEAFIITNYHVVADTGVAGGIARKISLFLYGSERDGCSIPATFLGGSAEYDIAVLRVAPNERMKAAFPTAASLVADYTVGQHVLAVGNPEASGISVTAGTLSVLSEQVEMPTVHGTKVNSRLLRYDAAVNGGSSGGGLFDGNGCLIGIVNAKLKKNFVDGICYAIPLSVAVGVADSIIATCDGAENKAPLRADLGFTAAAAEDPRAEYDGETGLITLKETVRITAVTPDSAADGKIFVGDTVLSVKVDARPTLTPNRQYEVTDELLYARAGSTVTLTLLRNGEEVTVTLPLEEKDFTAC